MARGRAWLQEQGILAPADYTLRRAIGPAGQKARTVLMNRMMGSLSLPMRKRLHALVAIAQDDPVSTANRIKATPSRASSADMGLLLAKLEGIEDTGVLQIDTNWINGNYQRFPFHSARTMSADRLREKGTSPILVILHVKDFGPGVYWGRT